jgi:chromosomal replication initiator protein
MDKDKIWKDVLESVRVSVSPAIFSTWLTQTHLASLKKADKSRYQAEVGCASLFVKTTVENRYFGLIQDALIKNVNLACDLSFVVKEGPKVVHTDLATPLFQSPGGEEDRMVETLTHSKIRPGFTFENFAVSGSNQMAWAASDAVAKNPGEAYNPLFIWGGVGVGKSHLMNAVGYELLKKGITEILFVTGEQFTNDIVEGIRNKTTPAFRNKYRKLKALFIDDIQFIAGKDTVQEEFFHTFNAVTGAGGQVILTSDQPPSEISKLEERLKSRFEAGLIVDVAAPDFELRCAIVQIKARQRGLNLEPNIVQLIAGNKDGARKIEGFLIILLSAAKVKKAQINEEFVASLLGKTEAGENGTSGKKATVEEMVEAVSQHFSVGKRALMGKGRTRVVARPRQILMYLLRTQLGLPLEEVGRLIGGRDHSTVIHAVDKITRLSSSDVQIREDLLGIKKFL